MPTDYDTDTKAWCFRRPTEPTANPCQESVLIRISRRLEKLAADYRVLNDERAARVVEEGAALC